MNKAFSRVNWKNLPSKNTPLSAGNLNRSDSALDEIDNRVIELDNTKADASVVGGLVKDVTYNSSTGVFTITKYDGTTKTYDTDIEKVVTNFTYDSTNRQLILYDAGGQVVARIDLSDFVTVNEFDDSDTIAFTTEGTNISAEVKKHSITGEYLQPDYLADVQVQASLAQTSAEDAAESATHLEEAVLAAQSYAVGGTETRPGEDTDNAKYYKEQAEHFATSDYAIEAKSYAKGGTGTREGEDTDNAKYYKEQAALSTITGVTATIDDAIGTPSVEVTQTSPTPNKSFRFDFHNLKGVKGDKGDTGVAVLDSHITDDDHLIITLEDGTEIDAGIIGTNIREMTRAEYEALPNDVKNDEGLYFWITDEDGGSMAIVVSAITDYETLDNKPSINGVELIGDKSLDDLGIHGSLIEITQSDFDNLSQEEKDDPDIWYWITE